MRSSTCQIQGTLDGGEDEKEDQQQDSTQHVELVVWEVSREALAQTERTPMVTVVICGEEYTSRTCSKCGHLMPAFTEKTFWCSKCKHTSDRDVNAGCNILMKQLQEEEYAQQHQA